jgi:hypothetical protein
MLRWSHHEVLLPLVLLWIMCVLPVISPDGAAAFCGQSPLVSAQVKVRRSPRESDVTVNLRHDGTKKIVITGVSTRILTGSGAVVFVSPLLPSAFRDDRTQPGTGLLKLEFRSPSSAKRFTLTVQGTAEDSLGRVAKFSFSQAITPAAVGEAAQR